MLHSKIIRVIATLSPRLIVIIEWKAEKLFKISRYQSGQVNMKKSNRLTSMSALES